MFIPGQVLLEQLSVSNAGVWFIKAGVADKPAIVAKLPTISLKAVYRGKLFYLLLAIVKQGKKHLLFSGFVVDDDPTHPLRFAHPLFDNNQFNHTENLRAILSTGVTRIHFFDEQNYPVASAECVFDQSQLDIALKILKIADLPDKYVPNVYEQAQDKLLKDLALVINKKMADHSAIHLMGVVLNFENPITISRIDPEYLAYISENTTNGYRFDNYDEGGALETSAYQGLMRIFTENTFHSPFVEVGKTKRELTDILGFGDKQICLLESKALALLKTSLDRKSAKKVSLIQKDINKGLRQLKGAIKELRTAGGSIYHNDQVIIVPDIESSCINGIVLISEMYPFLDWENVAKKVIEFSAPDRNVFFSCIRFTRVWTSY